MLGLLGLVLTEELIELFGVRVLIENQVVLELAKKFKLAAIFVVLPGVGLHKLLLLRFGFGVFRLARLVLVLRPLFIQNGGRLIQRIKSESERVVKQLRDDAGKQGTADLETRVRVRFDQVDLEVLINHKVVTENLE